MEFFHLCTLFSTAYNSEKFLRNKIGAVVFANFGKVYGNDNEFSDADWLIGGGFGLRYFILPYERIHTVLDAAWSEDTFAMYFGLRAPF